MKSNMDYLREFIEGNETALEFFYAVQSEIDDANDEIKELKAAVSSHESYIEKQGERIEELEELLNEDCLESIDFGIGIIEYKQPDNIKLQMFMDDLKDKHEHSANFATLSLF